MDPEKTRAVVDCPVPESHKQLQGFLGFANFYRLFIRGYSSVPAPLHKIISSNVIFIWNPVFQELKKQFTSAPILKLLDLK